MNVRKAISLFSVSLLLASGSAFGAESEASAPFAQLVECGQAYAKFTFNASPTDANGAGISTEYINMPEESFADTRLTFQLGTVEKPVAISLTKNAIYLTEDVQLFYHEGMLTSIIQGNPYVSMDSAIGNLNVTKFETYPFRSYNYGIIGDRGRMYGYSKDKVTQITPDHKVTDLAKIQSLVEQLEKEIKTRVELMIEAIIDHAEQRIGLKPRTARHLSLRYDLAKSNATALKQTVCKCKQLRNMENLDLYATEKLISSKGQLKDHGPILILDNELGSIGLGERPAVRQLDGGDLNCSYM